MSKRPFNNRLNDLSPKEWVKFQKSWFVHNPPPRRKDVLRHPAKFPETLAQEFIEFFTKKGQVVLDPMAGTGSALVAALRSGRQSYGIELNPAYIAIARQIISEEKEALGSDSTPLTAEMISGNALEIGQLISTHNIPPIHYVLTSPPYWDMLHAPGAQTQKSRRETPNTDVFYSDNPNDLGNIHNYDEFIEKLSSIFIDLKPHLMDGAYLTIIVKNVKKRGTIYPLAWDLAKRLCAVYALKDEKIWAQDNQRLAPYGIGNAWVSNTFHHYCLQFRKEG